MAAGNIPPGAARDHVEARQHGNIQREAIPAPPYGLTEYDVEAEPNGEIENDADDRGGDGGQGGADRPRRAAAST
jgi:hypothetical protein